MFLEKEIIDKVCKIYRVYVISFCVIIYISYFVGYPKINISVLYSFEDLDPGVCYDIEMSI